MAARQERGWQFSTLFLVKDSLGVMLEAGGLLEDALREYYELEACFLEALSEAGALTGHIFGALALTAAEQSDAVMLEAGGLLDDAMREYYELEACFLEALLEVKG